MTVDAPLVLWVAPVIGVLVAGLGLWARLARVRRARRWSEELAGQAARMGRLGPILLGLAALAATVGLAGPRWGTRVVTTETKGLNLVIAVDVSRSMMAEDVVPSRLERAKRQARRLVRDLEGDRIGLIAFAGQSFTLSPLTVDGSALLLMIDALDPTTVSAGGTELASVLTQGHDLLFAGTEVADRVLVLFTDGEAHDSLPSIIAAATRMHRAGVRVVLVGEGRPDGARIPVRDPDGALIGFQRDPADQLVETMRRDDILIAVQDAAHGALVPAELQDQAGAVRDLIAGYKRALQATTSAAQDISRAWIPLLIAVILLLAHTVTRRSMALAGLLLFVAGHDLHAQEPRNLADEAWEAGELRRSAELFLRQALAGDGGDTTWFNAGTAALAMGDTALARRALERVAASLEPDLRYRALYNLGVMYLGFAEQDSANVPVYLEVARQAYREALLLNPSDRAAKWNLELAIRRMPPPSGEGSPPPPRGGEGIEGEPPPPPGLSLAQAEQILNSMAEEERRSRRDILQRWQPARQTRGRWEW